MRYNYIIKTIIYSCLFLFALSAQATSLSLETKQVQAAYYAWCNAIATAKGDPNKIIKFYAHDAILLPTLSAKVLFNENHGFDEYFTHLTALKNIQCIPKKLMTQLHGKIAINNGLYAFSYTDDKNKPKYVSARFTFIYKQFNHQWLIVNHHSSELP